MERIRGKRSAVSYQLSVKSPDYKIKAKGNIPNFMPFCAREALSGRGATHARGAPSFYAVMPCKD
ncbi:MAG: hypothetical protein ABH870_01955 [bacterium]